MRRKRCYAAPWIESQTASADALVIYYAKLWPAALYRLYHSGLLSSTPDA